jgi:hypothetical protein
MSRSGYIEDIENWQMICWRGAVKSAIRGKRGQKFLTELLTAFDNMANKRLIQGELEADGEFCSLGVIGSSRGLDLKNIDPEDYEVVSNQFNIAEALVREIVYMNDEHVWETETPEQRWQRMRTWVMDSIA